MASAAKPAPSPKRLSEIFRSPATVKLVLCLLLAVLTLALYNDAGGHGFANYDDDRYVLTNLHVRQGLRWSTITWAFQSLDEANWHPLTWLSHALDCQLFQLNAAGHHYTSVLLQAVNVLLLFLLLSRLTGSITRSLMVAAVFAVHPLNVESVAWIAERKSLLAMLFFLLTLLAYGWYVRRLNVARYLLVAAGFTLSLMSKPMAIALPFALLLMDYWPLERVAWRPAQSNEGIPAGGASVHSTIRWLCLEKIPLLVLSAGSAIITMRAQKAGGAMNFTASHAPLLRVENALVCYVLYLVKAFWPAHLAILYPYPRSLPWWSVLGSAVFLVGVTTLVVIYRKYHYLPFGWFWYLGTMVPMIGLVQVGNQAMADRYAYLPLLGIFVIVVWGVADWAGSEPAQWERTGDDAHAAVRKAQLHPLKHGLQQAMPGLAACAIAALAAMTYEQLSYWRDDFTLWAHTLSVTAPNFVAENNIGAILARQGRYEEAVEHLWAASALEPDDPVSQLNLGVYAQQHHDFRQAIARYEATLQLATDSRTRASAYANLGQIFFSQHDYARARENFEAAAKLNNPYPLQLGLLAQKTGDWNRAAEYYAWAAGAEPKAVGFLLLEQALRRAGRQQEADRAHQQAKLNSSDLSRAQQAAEELLRQ
jgi:protein O-mannosyl-transferase